MLSTKSNLPGRFILTQFFFFFFFFRAQELCESRGGRPGLPSLISFMVSVDVKQHSTTTFFFFFSHIVIVQELCESRGGRPGLFVLTSLLVSVDAKNYCIVLLHWSQLVPNMSTDI